VGADGAQKAGQKFCHARSHDPRGIAFAAGPAMTGLTLAELSQVLHAALVAPPEPSAHPDEEPDHEPDEPDDEQLERIGTHRLPPG